jgi:hypothetical protein
MPAATSWRRRSRVWILQTYGPSNTRQKRWLKWVPVESLNRNGGTGELRVCAGASASVTTLVIVSVRPAIRVRVVRDAK